MRTQKITTTPHRAFRLVVLVAVALSIGPAPAAERVRARFADGRLAIEATEAPLDALLAAIGEETGAQVEGRPAAPPTLTISLVPTPLDEALTRLFPGASVALSWRTDGRPARIRWLGRGQEARRQPPPPKPPASSAAPDEPAGAVEPPPDADDAAVGSRTDPRQLAALLRGSQHLRRLVRQRMRSLDDREALAALRAVADERAESILRALADERGLGGISRRATRILDREFGR